jgi:hypothetical protein
METDDISIIQFELNNLIHYLYIEWPGNPVPVHMWRTNDKKIIDMENMDIGHLQACIRTVEKDLKRIQSRPASVSSILDPCMRTKLSELKEIFNEKVA